MAETLKAVRQGHDSRADILEVFTRLVAERGYDAVSVRDVAEEVGVSKGTIMHHFQSKDQLLRQVHADYMSSRIAQAKLTVEAVSTPVEEIAGMIYLTLFGMLYDRDATIAFAREIVRFASDELMADVRCQRAEFSDMLTDALERGMAEGSLRRENPAQVTLQIFGMINWSWVWFKPDMEWSIEDVADTFTRVILWGLGAERHWSDPDRCRAVIDAVRTAMSLVDEAPARGPAPGNRPPG